MDFDQPALFTRTDALTTGYTDEDLRRARATDAIVSIRRGWFIRADVYRTLDALQQHALLAEATCVDSADNAVLSHISAAVVLGLDLWDVSLDTVTMTTGRGCAGKQSRRRTLHGTTLDNDEWFHVDGMRVTRPARTIVDLARTLLPDHSVCVGDYALRHGIVSIAELEESVASAHNRTGAALARTAIGLMSARSDSVGESRSRLVLGKVSTPLMNQTILDENGKTIARVDFLFPDLGEVIAEFDGVAKYGSEPRKSIIAEKNRHNRLLEQGRTLLRFDWHDLSNSAVIVERLHSAHRRALRQGKPSGRFVERALPTSTPLLGIRTAYRGCGFAQGA